MMPALHLFIRAKFHIIAQIVKAELVVCAVGDVARVCSLALGVVVFSAYDHTGAKP